MRPLAMYVPEPGRGSSVPIDLFTAFALTQPSWDNLRVGCLQVLGSSSSLYLGFLFTPAVKLEVSHMMAPLRVVIAWLRFLGFGLVIALVTNLNLCLVGYDSFA
ncbi:hypothetical protein Tco_0779226 [Tanacetum coccineum]